MRQFRSLIIHWNHLNVASLAFIFLKSTGKMCKNVSPLLYPSSVFTPILVSNVGRANKCCRQTMLRWSGLCYYYYLFVLLAWTRTVLRNTHIHTKTCITHAGTIGWCVSAKWTHSTSIVALFRNHLTLRSLYTGGTPHIFDNHFRVDLLLLLLNHHYWTTEYIWNTHTHTISYESCRLPMLNIIVAPTGYLDCWSIYKSPTPFCWEGNYWAYCWDPPPN